MMPSATSSGGVAQQDTPGYVTIKTPANPDLVDSYLARHSKGIGITLILIGILEIVANGVVSGYTYNYYWQFSQGFWGGIWFIITGSFGIAAASKRRCLIWTFMVMGIMSAVLTVFVLFFGSYFASMANMSYYYSFDKSCDDHRSYQSYRNCIKVSKNVVIAMEAITAGLAIVAAGLSIWGSAICCKAIGCRSPNYNAVVVAAPYGQPHVFGQQPGTVQYENQCNQQAMTIVPLAPPSYPFQQLDPTTGVYGSNKQGEAY